MGIGIDVLNQQRIASLLARRGSDKLVSRILSSGEISDWNKLQPARQVQFLAVRCVFSCIQPTIGFYPIFRWSVKEAAYKALYPVLKPTWKELTYRGLQGRIKPTLEYCPVVPEEREKVGKIHVSISHDGDIVFATVLAQDAN